ncbi:OadG family transporter subunit [Akkermansia muciniphila]|uniref:OadG family transporter subunit n=1 Tax=Akkermansia muciniphila TaxID=239935 RepID=UPI0033AA7468
MLLTALAFAQGMANIMENLDYQIVGILVVMMCLGGLAVILTISGSIAASIQNKAKAKAAASVSAPAPAAAPAAAGKPGMTPEMLAILSAAVDSAMTELTPEMVAVISAAVDAGLDGMSHRIVEIKQSPGSGYAAAGRAEIFASHRIRPSH